MAPGLGSAGAIFKESAVPLGDRGETPPARTGFLEYHVTANLITLRHFSVSSAMSFAKSAGDPARGVPPRTASRSLILGSAIPALISLFSFSIIAVGVFRGAPTPYQEVASKPGTKSLSVGMSGSPSQRVALVTASGRSVPLLIYSIDAGVVAK
jgi:hypothetical protein